MWGVPLAWDGGVARVPLDPVSLLGDGSWPTTDYFENYTTVDGGTVTVTVSDGFKPSVLRDASDVVSTTVLDRPALVGTLADGSRQVVWQAADGKLCEARNPTSFLPKGTPSTCSPISSDGSRITAGNMQLIPI